MRSAAERLGCSGGWRTSTHSGTDSSAASPTFGGRVRVYEVGPDSCTDVACREQISSTSTLQASCGILGATRRTSRALKLGVFGLLGLGRCSMRSAGSVVIDQNEDHNLDHDAPQQR